MTSLDKFLPIIGVLVLLAYLTGYTFGRRRIQADKNTGEAVVRRLLSTVFAGNDYHLKGASGDVPEIVKLLM
jgi:hypothetical protein